MLLRRVEGDLADPLESRARLGSACPVWLRMRPRAAASASPTPSARRRRPTSAAGRTCPASPLCSASGSRCHGARRCGVATPTARAAVLEQLEQLVLHDTAGVGCPVRSSVAVFGSQLDDAGRAVARAHRRPSPTASWPSAKIDVRDLARCLTPDGVAPGTAARVVAVVGAPTARRCCRAVWRASWTRRAVADPDERASCKDVWVLDDDPSGALPCRRESAADVPQVDLRESLPSRAAEAMFWLGPQRPSGPRRSRATAAALADRQTDPTMITDVRWRGAAPRRRRRCCVDGASPPPAAPVMHGDPRRRASCRDRRRSHRPSRPRRARACRPGQRARRAEFLSSATTWRVLGVLEAERVRLDDEVASAYDFGCGVARPDPRRSAPCRPVQRGHRARPGVALPRSRAAHRARAAACSDSSRRVVSPTDPAVRHSLFDYVLAASESLVEYRRRYRSDAVLDAIVDLLLLDDTNPRALCVPARSAAQPASLLPATRRSARWQRDRAGSAHSVE